MKQGQYARAAKLLKKSLSMYPLPGVEALLSEAERRASEGAAKNTQPSSSSAANSQRSSRSNSEAPSPAANEGANGRSFTQDQAKIVKKVLQAKEGGRGAHYRVLGIEQTATESEIKKAYRKLSLKIHPDKNPAPHADEAFKALGLAYATLSDQQKRTIYDRYGDEDPDNVGGAARGPGGMQYRRGGAAQEVDPEEIFNMFFGGMNGANMRGGPGFHVYTNGFGGGFGPGMQFRRAQRQGAAEQRQPQGLGALMQFLPFLIIMLLSFFNLKEESNKSFMQNRYFSLTQQAPYINPLFTKLTTVKDIPYFVSDSFLRTYYRDRYQLGQVERLVEKSYQLYLADECDQQKKYQKDLVKSAKRQQGELREKMMQKARDFELGRCDELDDLFPRSTKQAQYGRR